MEKAQSEGIPAGLRLLMVLRLALPGPELLTNPLQAVSVSTASIRVVVVWLVARTTTVPTWTSTILVSYHHPSLPFWGSTDTA